jgi:hypothetical protein
MVESARMPVSAWDRADADPMFAGFLPDFGVEDYAADVVLRHSASRQCAWGLITLNRRWVSGYVDSIHGPSVWLDTSHDEGRTMSLGLVNERVVPVGHSTSYTATFSTMPYTESFSIRACGRGVHTHTAIGGKYNRKAGRGGVRISTSIHSNGVVCTAWLTTRG